MSPPSKEYDSTNTKDFYVRSRPRSRTMSILTVSSSSSYDITKALSPSPTICSRADIEQAFGSFIPVRSAANCLRDFTGNHTTTTRTTKKRRRVTFQETSDSSSDELPQPAVSFHSRPPKKSHQNLTMASPPTINDNIPQRNGLHPVLAKLEKESRFCSLVSECAICRGPGVNSPRCRNCKVVLCSRACRLDKRHVC